jgi:hypothetical protein
LVVCRNALQLVAENVVTGWYTTAVTRQYTTGNAAGRPAGVGLDWGYAVSYAYDDVGRFASLTSRPAKGETNVFQYSWVPDSGLLAGWTNPASGFSFVRSFESHRDLITQVKTCAGTNLISQYDYSLYGSRSRGSI